MNKYYYCYRCEGEYSGRNYDTERELCLDCKKVSDTKKTIQELEKQNAELKHENEFLKNDRACDAGTLNGLGEEFAKVKKQNAELGELVDAVIDVLEITEDCLSDWTGSSDKAQIGLFKEKLKKIKGE